MHTMNHDIGAHRLPLKCQVPPQIQLSPKFHFLLSPPPPPSPNQVSAMLLCQFLNFRPYVQIYHANFDQSMITQSYLQNDTNIEWSKFLQAKFPTPFSTFLMLFGKPCFNYCLFFFLLSPFFVLNFINFFLLTPLQLGLHGLQAN